MTDDTDWRERALRAEADLADAKRDLDKTTRDLCRWRAAIQKMTSGGSEFMDPRAVADWAEMQKLDCAKAKMAAASARKALASVTAQRDAAVEALSWFIRWYEAVPAREFIPGPINVGIANARQALADHSFIFQRREREKAVIEAARAWRRSLEEDGWTKSAIELGITRPGIGELMRALASLDKEGASNAG